MTEQLPVKKKARWRKRISYGIAIVLTGVIAAVGYRQSQLLPRRISAYVNEHYLKGTNFQFSVDGVSGFLLRHVTFKNPTLRYHSASASYNVFRADEVSIDYDLMPIFAFRLIVTDLTLRNVAIHLRQDADGKVVLPVLPRGRTGKFDVSPVVNVRHFGIDGLEMKFGGDKRELAVRDVRLKGALEYEKHTGHLIIDDGGAYLINSQQTVSGVRLDVEGDASSLDLNDFAAHLDKSFVVARGGFRDGRLRHVEVVFNPISLSEMHQLGVAPDKQGVFSGRASLDGPVDSLEVEGQISGTGLGVELSAVNFKGLVTPKHIAVANMNGAVFGSKVNGAFTVDLKTEDFVYDGQVYDLDLGRGFITDTELRPMTLTGHIWVKNTKKDDRFDWVGELSRGVYDGFEAFNVRAAGTTTKKDGTTIERAHLERPGFSADGSGTVSADDQCDVVFKVDATDLAYFWKHFKLPVVGGATHLNGHLEGPIDDFTVNLNGPFRNLLFEPCLVDSGTVVAEARRIGTLAPEVTVSVDGHRGSLAGVWFDRPVVHLEIDTTRVEIPNAHFARGDTAIVVDLDVRGKGDRATIDVRNITVTTPTDVWTTTHASQMHVEPNVLHVDSLTLACPRGELGGQGVIRGEKNQTLDFTAWGRGINLGVVRDVLKLPFRVDGRGSFKLALSGPVDDPHGHLDVAIAHGVIDSVAFDNMTARAGFDGSSYQVESLQVVANKDTMRANGTWMSDVSPARIARGERTDQLWNAPLRGRFVFAHYPLATVFKAAHRPTEVAAAFQGSVDLGGTLDSPTARIRGSILPAPGPGRQIPPAEVDISYADGFLRVARFNTTEELNLKLSGSFPLTLSARHGAHIEENEPLKFKLDIAPRKNAPVEIGRYITGVSRLSGIISGTIEGSGTPDAPRLSGGLALTHGNLGVVGLHEQFNDIAVRVDFIDDVVRLTSLSARSGEKGSLVASGWARVSNYKPADYKLDLTMHDFWLSSIDDVEMRTDGNVSVRLQPWRDGRKIPNITGKLRVKEANITMDVMKTTEETGAQAAEFTRPTDQPTWLASIDLNADKNVWIRNPDLIAELEGDVILNRDEQGLYFRGDMTILRGSYKVFANKFEITDGTFDFSASETLRPSMQIDAYTPHHDPNGESGNIYLALSWPYDQKEPRIRLSYDQPGYSEPEIWAMLGGLNNPGSVGTGVATNALERVINAQMSGGFNVNVGQRSYNVDNPANGKPSSAQVTTLGVSKYLWEDIYLEYQRDLSTSSQQEVNVEYRLGRRFLIRSQMIYNSRRQTGANANKGTDEYNLDLKYRFEF